MKTYTIFIMENKKNRAVEDVILVKEGFNFFAMIFNIFWLLYNRLWLFAAISFILINFILSIFSTYVYFIFLLLFAVFIGFEANNLLIYRFQRENYTFAGFSLGNDEDDAKIKFLDSVNKENKDKGKIIY